LTRRDIVKHSEGTFKGVKDFDLSYQQWLPDGDSKAVLIMVHGLAEHIGRYKNPVNYFVPKGWALYGYDLRGHGKSQGLKGYVERFSYFVDDTRIFFDRVKKENPGKKIFLIGHSMGGLIVSHYALKYQKELDGLVVSGPTIRVGYSISPMTLVAVNTLSVFAPKRGVSTLNANDISRDQVVVDAYINDPLVYRGKTKARLGAEFLNAIVKITKKIPEITLPLLIVHGANDMLSNPSGSQLMYEKAGSKDKTLKVYEHLFHEVFNEPEHEKVLSDVEAWLNAHLK
jgi:acylglycerol lipase